MLRKIALATIAISTFASATMANAVNAPQEQVWEAVIQNNNRVCGVEYNGGKQVGGILTKAEQGTDSGKAITFRVKANTHDVYWKITEAKLIDNRDAYDFNENLMLQATKELTSVFVNNREYAWGDVQTPQYIQKKDKYIKLAPKINMDESDLPYGTTRIQGKIVVTCGGSPATN